MSLSPKPPTRFLGFGAALATTVVIAALLTPQVATAAESLPAPDGASAATAAASCWEVKQTKPTATSGIYWLVTPELGAPQQFYCDQETDGGGWVLVGRGREDWSDTNEGWGTPAEVRNTITGTAAFKPRQLSATVIGGLLNGTSVSSLPDGIRLHRATNIAGTSWQDATFTFASPRDDWAWVFDNQQRVKNWTIGGVSGTGGQTAAFGSGTGLNRIETKTGANQGWMSGFGFGTSIHGSQASDSYLWEASIAKGNARPFTQVFLRPKLASADIFTTIPDSGTVKRTIPAAADSFALPTVWGVAGLGNGPSASKEGNNEVSAFAEGNGVVYVGGNFLTVQKSSTGASAVSQPYLAAFDVKTGEWISSFRPQFDGQVKALAVLPDGRLAAGGYFTTVNGNSRPAFAVLDAKTGALDTSFTTRIANKLSSGVPFVRSLDVQGDWLYIGGTFTHITGGTPAKEKYMRSAGRVSVTDGTPADSWNPEFDGTVVSLDASAQGDRVYFAGYFSTSRGTDALRGAVITTDTASVIPWTIDFSSTTNYQQAVKEVGNRVWIGGSQHMLYSYARSNMSELSTNIGYPNGDIQAISTDGDVVYAGCHCFYTDYAGARRWPDVGTSWTAANKINSAGGWSNATGKYVTQFNPTVSQRGGAGAWALFNDSTGVTWFGGDYKGSVKAGWTQQWSGGFVRFAHNDTSAPSSPTNLKASVGAAGTTLSWSGATDDSGKVTYEVLRNDRVIATTTSLSATVPAVPVDVKYFVRAADASGNRSASTSAVPVLAGAPVDPNPPASDGVLIPAGSSWKYYYEATAPASAWNTTGFDDSAWKSGAAPIGRGTTDIKTTLTAVSPYPLTSYYRKAVAVTDATKVASVTLTARSDDGIVIYVNGKEVARNNMPTGTIGFNSYATAPISGTTAVANPITFTVPGSAFVTGTNSITAEVHSNYRAASSHSFEMAASVKAGSQPAGDDPADPPADGEDPPADPGDATTLVTNGADWQYYYADTAPGSGWNSAAFDASAWKTGAAPIGRGTNDIATTLTAASPYPLTSYYRKAVSVTDASKVASVTLTARSDDGIVIYVNGSEVARNNMGTGTVDFDSYATSSVSATNALANPVTFQVPGSAFVTGANLITAEVHSNYHSASSHSFELAATVNAGTQPAADDPVDPPADDPVADGVLVAAGANWQYYYSDTAPGSAWATAGFDASSWQTGAAPIGRGTNDIATTLTAASPYPLTSYYRKAVSVTDASKVASVTLTARSDDGIVIYVNGKEVGRNNMPTGTVTANTYATAPVSASTAVANPVTVTVPGSAFVTGSNLITAEVHSNYHSASSHSFELTAAVK